jgi:hypothetical protein
MIGSPMPLEALTLAKACRRSCRRTSSSPAALRIERHGFSRLTNGAPSFVTYDDVRIAVHAREFREHRERRGRQVQRLGARLAVRQTRFAALEIDPIPSEPEHLAEPAAGEDKQLDRCDDVGRTVMSRERIAEPRQFVRRQGPLARLRGSRAGRDQGLGRSGDRCAGIARERAESRFEALRSAAAPLIGRAQQFELLLRIGERQRPARGGRCSFWGAGDRQIAAHRGARARDRERPAYAPSVFLPSAPSG